MGGGGGGVVLRVVGSCCCQTQEGLGVMGERGGAAARLRQTTHSYLSTTNFQPPHAHAGRTAHPAPVLPHAHSSQDTHAPPHPPHLHPPAPAHPHPHPHHSAHARHGPPPPHLAQHPHAPPPQTHDASSRALHPPAPLPPAAIPGGTGGNQGQAWIPAAPLPAPAPGPQSAQHPPPPPPSERGAYQRNKQGGAERRGGEALMGREGEGGSPDHGHRAPAALVAQLPAQLGGIGLDDA